MPPTLHRTPFEFSRSLEFFTEKELSMQIGYKKDLWPLVLCKELIDNALDACEQADRTPDISIELQPDSVSVADNGPGLPASILEKSLDYLTRTSDKAFYVSPSRGQLGNALKCLWAAAYVASGENQFGIVDVETGGTCYRIEVNCDRIAQQPQIELKRSPSSVKSGTKITLHWQEIASYLDGTYSFDFYQSPYAGDGVLLSLENLIVRYAAMNPHAGFRLQPIESAPLVFQPIAPTWKKWKTDTPTSSHWYRLDDLVNLIAGYLQADQQTATRRTLRDFIGEFHGLSGSQAKKDVLEAIDGQGVHLDQLVKDGEIDRGRVGDLLDAMQERSKPVKPKALGIIGKTSFQSLVEQRLGAGAFQYRKKEGVVEGLPYVIEVCFGVLSVPDWASLIWTGLNWSPVLKIPFPELPSLLNRCRVESRDPVVVFVHLACPRLNYTERGKGAIQLPANILQDLDTVLNSITQGWQKAKRRADRNGRVREKQLSELTRQQQRSALSLKEAAYQVMEQAYMQASDNNSLPANARQIMYAARPLVLELTGGKIWKNSSYFTQELLNAFIRENPELTADWDVVFDARGHLSEPHTANRIDLGTLAVRSYRHRWQTQQTEQEPEINLTYRCHTTGPTHRFNYALFIEKEGFQPLLQRAQVSERFDIAIMSTKGMSVTAARSLVEELSAHGVKILVLHDFDKAGFSILHTLKTDTERYQFELKPDVVDIGLRLADVEAMGLDSEAVTYAQVQDPREGLRDCGATEAECDFLVERRVSQKSWEGQRVELNAMTSRQFIQWLERKLVEQDVTKVVPDQKTLEQAFLEARKYAQLNRAIEQFLEGYEGDAIAPENLKEQIAKAIEGTAKSWDAALEEIARDAS